MINHTVHPVASSLFYCRLFLNYDLSLCSLVYLLCEGQRAAVCVCVCRSLSFGKQVTRGCSIIGCFRFPTAALCAPDAPVFIGSALVCLLFFDLVGLNCCPSSKHTINSELTGTAADWQFRDTLTFQNRSPSICFTTLPVCCTVMCVTIEAGLQDLKEKENGYSHLEKLLWG